MSTSPLPTEAFGIGNTRQKYKKILQLRFISLKKNTPHLSICRVCRVNQHVQNYNTFCRTLFWGLSKLSFRLRRSLNNLCKNLYKHNTIDTFRRLPVPNKKSLATECCKGFLWVTDGIRTHDIQNHNLTL